MTEGRRIGIHRGILLGLIQGFLYVVLYGATALIFWYGPHLIRSECQNYSPGGWIVVCIQGKMRLMLYLESFSFLLSRFFQAV